MFHKEGSARGVCLSLLVLTASPLSAVAQSGYPSRTVKIVVPVPPGPLADAVPRIVADKLSVLWGKPVIVENRPGAALTLGAEAVAKAEPDGYTLLATPPDPLVVAPHLSSKLGYDPRSFVPVTTLVKFPFVLSINPKVPATTLAELIAYAKANPGKLTFGSSGAGSLPHLLMEDLMRTAGIRLVHVPYQGLGPAMRDIVGGHIDALFDAIGNVLPFYKDGQIRLLAIAKDKRAAELPDVPTIAETLPVPVRETWLAVVAPPKTPQEIAAKVSQAVNDSLRDPGVARRLANFVVTPGGGSPAETEAFLKSESESSGRVIAAAGIKSE